MSEADVHVPEKRKRNAEANQDHLQNKDQINWKKKKTEKNTGFTYLAQISYQIDANHHVITSQIWKLHQLNRKIIATYSMHTTVPGQEDTSR